MAEVTRLLEGFREGRPGAAAALLQLVYDELRRIARVRMAGVPPGDTLQPTALVHEAYLRLFAGEDAPWQDRAGFFNAAARAMRNIVVEQARRHASLKRGGGRNRIAMGEVALPTGVRVDELLALDDALNSLEETDKTSAGVVMLRYFAGMTITETAHALGVSPATVDRYWRYARAWLRLRIDGESTVGGGATQSEHPAS